MAGPFPARIWSIVSEYLPGYQVYRNKRISSMFLQPVSPKTLHLDDLVANIKSPVDLNVLFPDLHTITMSYNLDFSNINTKNTTYNSMIYGKLIEKLIIYSSEKDVFIGGFSAKHVKIELNIEQSTTDNSDTINVGSLIYDNILIYVTQRTKTDTLFNINIVSISDKLEHFHIDRMDIKNMTIFSHNIKHITTDNDIMDDLKVFTLSEDIYVPDIIKNVIIKRIPSAFIQGIQLITCIGKNSQTLALKYGPDEYVLIKVNLKENNIKDNKKAFMSYKKNFIGSVVVKYLYSIGFSNNWRIYTNEP